MAPTVTQMRFQKKNPNRVNIYLDGRYAFSLNALEAVHLRRGQQLSAIEVEQLRDRDAFQLAYDQALRFLGPRPRSQMEMRRYLQRKEQPPERIEAVLGRLQDAGLVDDRSFARFWVENRQAFRPRGRRALQYELRQKGVTDEEILRATEGLETESQAVELALRQAPHWQGLDRAHFRRRMMGYLMRRGFDYAEAQEAVRQAWEQQSNQDELSEM
ncbi:MAG: RecX family transcriptional regulator [Chloroflexi bacterium]|nr:RecX family transcriptional regulator [Chloroflexota bacterium]